MNKILKLIIINIKDTTGRYMQQLNAKGRITGKLIAILPLISILPAIAMTALIYDSFASINMGHLALTYASIGSVVFMLVTSVPLIVSSFFYGKDLTLLATLPIKGRSIIIAKLAGIYPVLLAISTVLFGSTSIFYLIDSAFPIRATLIIFLVLLTLPLAPIAIGTLITLPFMSLVAGRKHRNLFTVLGNILLLGIILGIQVIIGRTASNTEAIVEILSEPDGLLNLIGKSYPPSIWLTKAISTSNLDLLWTLILQIACLFLIFLMAAKIYDQALKKFNQQESSGDRQKISYKKTGIKILLLKRNLGIIFTNPTFLLNTVMTLFIPVIIFVLYNLMGIMDLDTLNNPLLLPYRIFIFFGIVISPSIMGSLSATSISREGKFFWETRVMPIRHSESLASRELTTLLLNGIGQILLAIVTYIILPIEPVQLVIVLTAVIFFTLLMSKIDLIINIERPFLNWSNPTACIKNNMNVMLSLGSRVIIGGLGYLLYTLLKNQESTIIMLMLAIMALILYMAARLLIAKIYLRKYEQIDAI